MLLSVPIGISFLGCGTVTMPGLFGCLKCWCDPLVRTSTHPSALRVLMTSADVTRTTYNR